MKLVVICRELRYAGKNIFAGEQFNATDKDAKILIGIGKARDAGRDPVAEGKIVRQSDLPLAPAVVERDATPPSAPVADAKTRRTYRRRDMTAED